MSRPRRLGFHLANLAWLQGRLEDGSSSTRMGGHNYLHQPFPWRLRLAHRLDDLAGTGDTSGAARLVAEMLVEQPLEDIEPLDRPYFGFVNLYSAIGDENQVSGHDGGVPRRPYPTRPTVAGWTMRPL